MTWMNEIEIDTAVSRWQHHPVLGPATRTLSNLRDAVNRNSDGWPYWTKPARAADHLMQLILHDGEQVYREGREPAVTMEMLQAAYRPIRAFRKKSGLDFKIDEGGTRRVIVTTICTADVQEAWSFDAPVDWSLEQVQEAFGEENFGGMEFVVVVNTKVDGERERDVTGVEEVSL